MDRLFTGRRGRHAARGLPAHHADGSQNNTKFLLRTGWRGLWIEADPGRVAAITTRHRQSIERGDLVVMNRCVTPDNITALLVEAQIPADLDLLSIDIDGADYHVWEALTGFSPRVVMIEYNSIYPPDVAHVPPYHSASQWDRSRDFGASLKALQQLGDRLGYKLVGCNLAGVNAVFVREDLVADAFCAPFTAENHYEPPRYYLTLRRFGHRPSSF